MGRLITVAEDNETIFIANDFDALQCILEVLVESKLYLIDHHNTLITRCEANEYFSLAKEEKRFLQTFEYRLADIEADIEKFTQLQYESA